MQQDQSQIQEVMAPRTDHKDLDVENNNTNDIEAENGDNFQEDDAEAAELARLRCESVTTEEKRQQANRAKRSIDYPGLAFGSAMFGSDTLMKFSIIKNELHNIMRSHLKRVDGEVVAMAQRIKALDENLALSEQYIKTATATLAEAVQHEREHDPGGGEDDDHSALSQFDAQLSLLGHRLLHAKMLAAEACGEAADVEIVQSSLRRHESLMVAREQDTVPEPLDKEQPQEEVNTAMVKGTSIVDPSAQNCLLSAPPVPAPKALRRPFSVLQKPD